MNVLKWDSFGWWPNAWVFSSAWRIIGRNSKHRLQKFLIIAHISICLWWIWCPHPNQYLSKTYTMRVISEDSIKVVIIIRIEIFLWVQSESWSYSLWNLWPIFFTPRKALTIHVSSLTSKNVRSMPETIMKMR